MKKLTGYFLQGLVVLLPAVISIYVVYVIFTRIDSLLHFSIPGMFFPGEGLIITVILITLIGFLASSIFAKALVALMDSLFEHLPLVKIIYHAVRDLLNAFAGDKKLFTKPVLVTVMPGSGTKVIGFITNDDLSSWGLGGSVTVYLPQSCNFAGFLIVVPKEQVTPLDKDSAEVMAFVVSAGISGKTKN